MVVTNGDMNIRAAAQALGHRHIYYVAHLLYLMVKDILGLGSAEHPSLDAEIHDFRHLLQMRKRSRH